MLQNTKILVLEEEFLIAIDLQEMLEANGATDLVFASTVNEAEALLQRGRDSISPSRRPVSASRKSSPFAPHWRTGA